MHERRITTEILTGIKRAGADLIITYHAREMAAWHDYAAAVAHMLASVGP